MKHATPTDPGYHLPTDATPNCTPCATTCTCWPSSASPNKNTLTASSSLVPAWPTASSTCPTRQAASSLR